MQRAALVGLILLGATGLAVSQTLEIAEHSAKPGAYSAVGYASWYGREFHGRRTADGEVFDMGGLTAAHRTMPLPCYARVTNLHNGRSMIVRVNDRGPFVSDRLIDVSAHVADLLDFHRTGMTKVRVEFVGMAPAGGGDAPALLASLKTGESSDEGVTAFAATPARPLFAASGALAAANRVAALGPVRTVAFGPPIPARTALESTASAVVADAYPPRDRAPPSPYGDLVPFPSPYGELAAWTAEPSAPPNTQPQSLIAELRR